MCGQQPSEVMDEVNNTASPREGPVINRGVVATTFSLSAQTKTVIILSVHSFLHPTPFHAA